MKRSWLLVGLFIPLCLLAASRGSGQVSVGINVGAPAPAHYWYYPDSGIYYDYGAHVYFYSDGGNWVRVHHLPPRFRHLGHHEMVESERGRPWAHYDEHRAKYPPGQRKKEMREDDRNRDHGPDHDDHGRHHDED